MQKSKTHVSFSVGSAGDDNHPSKRDDSGTGELQFSQCRPCQCQEELRPVQVRV